MIIGLVGKARCGKTTLAEHWERRFGFEIISFADPLKEMMGYALPANRPPLELLYWPGAVPDAVSAGKEPDWRELLYVRRTPFTRWLLQFVGTDVVRDGIDKNYWAKQGARRIIASKFANKNVVIPDLRFENEALIVQRLFGQIIKIERAESSGAIEAGLAHRSETELDQIEADRILENKGTMKEFLAAADDLLDFDNLGQLH